MTKSSNTLKVQKGSTVYTCDLYDTTAEAKVYGASGYLPVKVGSANLYAPLYPATGWTQGFYDNYGTPVHVKNGSTEYVLAQKSLIQLNITAVAHQTITVTTNINGVYSSPSWTSGNRYYPYGTTWSVSHTSDTGWTKGTLSPANSGTLTNANITITATAATHNTYKITLPSTSNQTITIHYKNHNGSSLATSWSTTTSSITLGHGSQYYLTVAASTGYNAGSISNAGSSSSPLTLTAARSVTIGAASLKSYVLTLAATSNQTIKIRYKARNADGTMPSSWSSEISSGSSAKTYTLRHGSQYQITAFSASTGYNTGTLKNGSTNVSASTSTTYTMTVAITVSATAASLKTYTLTKSATNASTNQTLTVKYLPRNANGTYPTTWSTLSSGSVTLRHGSRWQGTVSANTGYTAGTVTNPGGTSSSMTGNVTVSVSAAKPIQYYLRYDNKFLVVKKNNSSGATISSGSKVNYNQTVYVSYSRNYDSIQYYLYKNSGASGTIWLKKYDVGSFTFNMPTSQIFISVTPFTGGGDA